MTWGLSSYETRFRWAAALWAVLMTIWCMCPLSWQVRLIGGAIWVLITILVSLRTAWWRPRSARTTPIVLVADGVAATAIHPETPYATLRPEALETLIKNLLAAGYHFQTVSGAIKDPMRKSVVLTFDGGSRDAYTTLFPILQRHHAKATCFVGTLDDSNPNILTPLEIREMQNSGCVEFGGTLPSENLNSPDDEIQALIARNRYRLTGILGTQPVAFAYPTGTCDRLRPMIKACGYTLAFGDAIKQSPSLNDPLNIPRRLIPRKCKPLQAYLLATRGAYHI